MNRTFTVFCTLVYASLALSGHAIAGPALDRIMNQMVLDSANGGIDRDTFKTVSPDTPLGQTFTTGAGTVEVSRIAVAAAYWNESWTEDESLVLTLWDSPSKGKRIASTEMPCKWKAWEGSVIMFTLNARVQPGTSYYFELTAKGGDGTIVGVFTGERYAGGIAFEGGKQVDQNIWFQIHGRPGFDKDAVYSDMFSNWNLDYAGLERVKAAVEAKDWETACAELVSFYEARLPEYESPIVTPKNDPGYDRSYADLVADQKIKDDEGNTVDLGPRWNYYRTWRTRGGVGLTRTGLRSPLAGAYMRTADEKFAKAFNEMILTMLEDQPCPLRSGVIAPGQKDLNPAPPAGIYGGSMWSGLSIGARMNQMWYFYSEVAASPSFTRDARAAMIFNMADMANVLAIQKGGGNWETQMSSALYELADRHPELKRSKEWFKQGIDTLFANLMQTVRPDGPLQEPTYNYHCLTVNRFTRTLLKCKNLKLDVDPRWERRVEKSLEFILYSMQPDFRCPARGDTYGPIDGAEYLRRMADYYDRPDFLWGGSHSKQGRPPLAASRQFPSDGWYIMRSDWTPGALYMNIRNGYDGGHGHADHNSITLSACGNNFITDPGVYAYGTQETTELSATRSHATVTVDEANTNRAMGTNTWASMRTADFFTGTNGGYQGRNDVTHTRKIAFMKPGYWIISDTVAGPGEHDVSVRFPFEPMRVDLDPKTGVAVTRGGMGNLVLAPCPGSGFVGKTVEYRIPRGGLRPATRVQYDKKTALPARFASLLYPFEGGADPDVCMERIGDEAYRVTTPSGTDYVSFGSVKSGGLAFDGQSIAVRTGEGPRSLAWVNGTSASINGREIASSSTTVKTLELTWEGDTLTINSGNEEPSLRVATLGARRCRVGCGPVKEIVGEYVEPFN